MMPTSGQLNVVPLALPPLKAPKALALAMAGLATSPSPPTRAGIRRAPSGDVSRPKFGVAVPAKFTAVTLARKFAPAWMKAAPVALAAAGLAKASLSRSTLLTWKLYGLTTKALLAPVMVLLEPAPVPSGML
jgi:hypothetical protein